MQLWINPKNKSTLKFGNKEWFGKEQIGIKEPFSVTNLPFHTARIWIWMILDQA